jgi:hypothetical protein
VNSLHKCNNRDDDNDDDDDNKDNNSNNNIKVLGLFSSSDFTLK